MNSSAAIKAFTGPARRHDLHLQSTPGPRCSGPSTSAAASGARGKVLFLPDQHLGRNTAVRDLGLSLEDCVVFDPHRPNGGLTREQLQRARMILWRGHCSVHGRFSVDAVRRPHGARSPASRSSSTPSASTRSCELADEVGSTEKIIKTIAAAPDGTAWAVGTELNLVKRLAEHVPAAADRLPGEERLLLLHDEPHRPAAPGLGARVARRRAGSSTRSASTPTSRAGPGWRSTRCSPCPARPARTDRRRTPDGTAGRGPAASAVSAAARRAAPAARPRPRTPARTRRGAGSRWRRAPGCRGPRRR